MCVYRGLEPKGKSSPPVDEWTLHYQVREGKIQPQTLLDCDGRVSPAAQIPSLSPLLAQAVKPLAPYLQPSQAGYVTPDSRAPSTRLTGAQITGILVGLGVLALWFINLPRPNTESDLPGQWRDVAVTETKRATHGKVNASR
jgi:hypothetical protein